MHTNTTILEVWDCCLSVVGIALVCGESAAVFFYNRRSSVFSAADDSKWRCPASTGCGYAGSSVHIGVCQ